MKKLSKSPDGNNLCKKKLSKPPDRNNLNDKIQQTPEANNLHNKSCANLQKETISIRKNSTNPFGGG